MAKQTSNVTNAFLYSLAIVSIIGFSIIIGNTFLDFSLIEDNQGNIILIILGIGLAIEGQIRKTITNIRDGLDGTELTHIVTSIIGIISIMVGLLGMVGINNPQFDAIKGVVASIAIVIIVVETWLVK